MESFVAPAAAVVVGGGWTWRGVAGWEGGRGGDAADGFGVRAIPPGVGGIWGVRSSPS